MHDIVKGLFARGPHRASRIHTFEGPRGYSARTAVYLRYAAYFLVIVMCSAVTHVAFSHTGTFAVDGGFLMFLVSGMVLVAGAAGTMLYTNQRNELIEQVRHYLFGMMTFPGAAVSLVMWGSTGMVNPNVARDTFTNMLSFGLPMVFYCTVVIPAILFIKLLAGMRTLHRSTMDDQEMVNLWTRLDGKQH
jgi:hypothetical protein